MDLQNQGCQVLAVPARMGRAIRFRGPVGFLELDPEKFGFHSRELHGRWTLDTMASATLWIDWTQVEEFYSSDLESEMSVEVI
jgi:hypothetical protein